MKLSEQQQAAVDSRPRSVCVSACAGAGKTATIVARYRKMMERGIDRQSIIIVTFTVMAAMELRQRIKKAGLEEPGYVGTIHGFCVRYLPDDLTVASEAVSESAKEWVQDAMPDEKFPSSLTLASMDIRNMPRIYEAYRGYLRRSSMVDFDGILLNMLLSKPSDVTSMHVIVDEYQDTGPWERAIYSRFASQFIVGDSRQSIYGFRGATGTLMERGSVLYHLDRSYRFGPVIANAVNQIEFKDEVPVVGGGASDGEFDVKPFAAWQSEGNLAAGAVLCRSNREVADWKIKLRALDIMVDDRPPITTGIQKLTDWTAVLCSPKNDLVVGHFIRSWMSELWPTIQSESERLYLPVHDLIDRVLINDAPIRLEPQFTQSEMDEVEPILMDYPDPRERLAALYELRNRVRTGLGWSVMTIHQAKGLEFDNVCLVVPQFLDSKEETKRLVYTAMTRAKDRLCLDTSQLKRESSWLPR